MKKKMLSMLLTLSLCLGLSISVFAAEVGDTSITTEDGFTYTLSNAIFGTETWTREGITKDWVMGTITDTIYLIPEGTTITLPSDKLNEFSLEYFCPPYEDNTQPIRSMGSGNPPSPSGDFIANMYNSYLSMFQAFPDYTPADVSGCVLRISHITWPDATTAQKEGDVYFRVAEGNPITTDPKEETPVAPESPSSWAAEQVNAAIAAGLVPEALQSQYTVAATRAEFCALAVALYETAAGSEITESATFSDTTDVNVQKMAGLGVVNGIGEDKFGSENKLTREQAATMLSRLADAMGKPLTAQAPTFADNTSISSWALDAVGQMQATGVMGGVGENTFSPAADYTREQSMMTIMRLFDIVK